MPYRSGVSNIRNMPLGGSGTTAERPVVTANGAIWINLDDPAAPVWQRFNAATNTWVDVSGGIVGNPWIVGGNTGLTGTPIFGSDADDVPILIMVGGEIQGVLFPNGTFVWGGTAATAGIDFDVFGIARVTGGFVVAGNVLVQGGTTNSFSASSVNRLISTQIELDGRVTVNNPNPPVSAALSITSTTMGFLKPKMTTAQRDAIVTPVAGLEIYNIDTNLPEFYNGTIWV